MKAISFRTGPAKKYAGFQRDSHRWVKVRTGDPGGQVDRHGDAQTPDDADFPLSEAGSRDLERSHAPNAEKDQQPGTEELCDALAF